ncbi:MAG: sensor histidine kinase [Bdellovibrionales bacterium]
MSSIRFRLLVLLSLVAAVSLTLALLCYRSFSQFREAQHQLDLSYVIRDELRDWGSPKSRNKELLKSWRSFASALKPERRQDEFSELLFAMSSRRSANLRERLRVFQQNELEFQRYTREHMDYLERKVVYFAAMTLVVLSLGFFGLQVFISRQVIRPILDLSRKMVDFLHDRYTYQFSVPKSDEIGHMQATFNSLAQRVISNMQQLMTLDQAKSEFLSIASHELRTPLTSIKGSLGLMRTGIAGQMNEMAEHLLAIAETETDRLIRLINDILDLAKIEAGKLPLQRQWSSLNRLVRACEQSLQALAQQAGVQIVAESMPPLEVNMDADRIQQVLTNLVSNAIKFSPKEKSVIIRCGINDGSQVVIEVKDQGRGIDPHDQEAIFQKFRQASSPKNPLVKGTGLGLAIARALVEEHGGEIGVRSIPGEGSTFYFTLGDWRYSAPKTVEVTP